MLYIAVLPLRDLDPANRRDSLRLLGHCKFIDIVSTRGSGSSFSHTRDQQASAWENMECMQRQWTKGKARALN